MYPSSNIPQDSGQSVNQSNRLLFSHPIVKPSGAGSAGVFVQESSLASGKPPPSVITGQTVSSK